MFNFETKEMSAQQVATCWRATFLTNAEDVFFRYKLYLCTVIVRSLFRNKDKYDLTSITHANTKKRKKNPQQMTYNIMATEEEKIKHM